MRKGVKAVVAAVAVAAAVILAAPPAWSAEPLPPPVDEILDVPSRTQRALHTSAGGIGNNVFRDIFGGMSAQTKPSAPGGAKPPSAVPKPITPIRPPSNALGALTMATLGWAIAANGTISVVSLISGNDYADVYCSQPDWYQGVTNFVSFGLGPECHAPLLPDVAFSTGYSVNTSMGKGRYLGPAIRTDGSIADFFCYDLPALSGSLRWVILSDAFYAGTNGPAILSGPGSAPSECTRNYPSANKWLSSSVSDLYGWRDFPALAVWDASQAYVVDRMREDQVQSKCRIEWEDGSVTTGDGAYWTSSMGVPMSASGLGCEQAYVSQPGRGPGLMPSRIKVDVVDDEGAITTIADDEVPEFSEPERKALWTTSARGLVLTKVVNGVKLSCNTWEADCAQWWDDTEQGQTPGPYRCEFGGQPVDLAECGPYRHTFDEKTSNPTITDPASGTQQPWGTSSPNSQQQQQNTTDPATGPTPGDQCMGEWSAVANPIEWVLHPVKCALVWAFVPRTEVVEAQFQSIDLKVRTGAVYEWGYGLIGPVFGLAGGVTGCDGIVVPAGAMFGHGVQDFRILNACPGTPLAATAAISSTIITAGALIGFVVAASRLIGGVFGFSGMGRSDG